MIFPKSNFQKKKLNNLISYPLEIFKKTKNSNKPKQQFKNLKNKLFHMLTNWKDYKPIRGKIEDFFKVSKRAFGLEKLHKYTPSSNHKTIYLSILLTTIAIQSGYNTKTAMQQLAEGNLNQQPRKKYKKKKQELKTEITEKETVPYKSQQELPIKNTKKEQTTLKNFLKI